MFKPFHSLIIGGGPAGLSVALGLSRLNRTSLVISNGTFRNDGIEASHAVLGHDHIHPQEIWARGREQIARYDTATYADAEIVSVERLADQKGFIVKSGDGRSWLGRTLVLASGVMDLLPGLPGYKENWPRNIYQCPFCDGWERRNSEKGVLGLSGAGIMEAKMARMITNFDGEGSSRVTVLSDGHAQDTSDEAVVKAYESLKRRGVKVDTRKIVEMLNADPEEGVDVVFEDGQRTRFGFLMHKPRTTLNAEHLIKRLGLETVPGMFGDVIKAVEPFQGTNVPGVFTAGDAGNNVTHVTLALSTGVGAAAGIVHYLNELEDRELDVPKVIDDSDVLVCKT